MTAVSEMTYLPNCSSARTIYAMACRSDGLTICISVARWHYIKIAEGIKLVFGIHYTGKVRTIHKKTRLI